MAFHENLRTLRLVRGLTQPALEITPEALANGDEHDTGPMRWRWVWIPVAWLVTLVVVFVIGRATAIYPLSFTQLTSGKSRSAEVTRSMLQLAPQGVDVGTISAEPNALFIMGTTPDRPTLDAYLQALQSHYGGEFPMISLSPEHPGELRHFVFRYQPDWSRVEIKVGAGDH